jgi:hypothetical protein
MKKLMAASILTLAMSSQAFAEADYQALGEAANYTASQVESLMDRVGGDVQPSPNPNPAPWPVLDSDGGSPWILENDAEVVKHLVMASERLRQGANSAFAAQDAVRRGDVRTMVEQGAFACGAINRAWSMLSVANAKAFEPEPFGGASRYRPFGNEIRQYADDTNIAYNAHCK